MHINIWDSYNRQWLEPMSFIFDDNGYICQLSACKKGENPLEYGYYTIRGEDLNKVAIFGTINQNIELLLNHDKDSSQIQPYLVERFADNGEISHWELIDYKNGDVLWSGPKYLD